MGVWFTHTCTVVTDPMLLLLLLLSLCTSNYWTNTAAATANICTVNKPLLLSLRQILVHIRICTVNKPILLSFRQILAHQCMLPSKKSKFRTELASYLGKNLILTHHTIALLAAYTQHLHSLYRECDSARPLRWLLNSTFIGFSSKNLDGHWLATFQFSWLPKYLWLIGSVTLACKIIFKN